MINNAKMTNNLAYYNYTLRDSSILGYYNYLQVCSDGSFSGSYSDTFEINGNGNPDPSGGVIAIFSIGFIIILSFITYVIIYSLGHVVKLDFDAIDLAINYGIYFGFVGFFLLAKIYLGHPSIINILEWAVKLGVLTNIFLPTLYFVLTLSVGSWMAQRVKGVDY